MGDNGERSCLADDHVSDSFGGEELAIFAVDVDLPEVGGATKMDALSLGYYLAFGGRHVDMVACDLKTTNLGSHIVVDDMERTCSGNGLGKCKRCSTMENAKILFCGFTYWHFCKCYIIIARKETNSKSFYHCAFELGIEVITFLLGEHMGGGGRSYKL